MDELENRLKPSFAGEKGRSKILDPTPQRKKFVAENLYKFFTNETSFAQLMGIPQKELYRFAEIGHLKLTYGRVEEAKRVFEALTQIDPQNYYYHSVLGTVYQRLKRYIEAVFQFTEALRYNPKDLASLVNRGEIYLLHKNYRKAADDFKVAIMLDPEGRNNYANRARSLVIAIKQVIQSQKPLPRVATSTTASSS